MEVAMRECPGAVSPVLHFPFHICEVCITWKLKGKGVGRNFDKSSVLLFEQAGAVSFHELVRTDRKTVPLNASPPPPPQTEDTRVQRDKFKQ